MNTRLPWVWVLCGWVFICSIPFGSQAQELEPRAYAALPKNLSISIIGFGVSNGNVLTNPALAFTGFKMTSENIAGTYMHTFGFAEKLARIQVTLPMSFLTGKVTYDGRDTSVSRSGVGDGQIRFGVNLTGSPPLDKRAFVHYTQQTIFGVSFVVSVPVGTYHSSKLINTGSHRWAFKPEVGISKRVRQFYLELYGGVWFYTNNNAFLSTKNLVQEPVFEAQTHVSYYFKNRMMLSFNATWFSGGQTIVDGQDFGPLLNNWRTGGTWSFPLGPHHSLRLQFTSGLFTTAGYDYRTVSIGYQHVF